MEIAWSWTEQPDDSSFVSGLALDADIKALQRLGDGHVMRGFDLDGGPTLDPPLPCTAGASFAEHELAPLLGDH